MQVQLLKSKILRATLTAVHMDYEGSLAIDSELMEKVGLLHGEKILVANFSNGERFETYAIHAPAGSKTFSLNGAAARKGMLGDLLVIMAFAWMDESEAKTWVPRTITLSDNNRKIIKSSQP
ncbi:MAG: aspartate 1-decarboxylase [Opitutales bacterium]|nr:aspartate 1-decarboxylase [Opitutales bacterium]